MREQRKEMPPEVKRGTGDVVDNQGKHREIGGTTVVVQTRRYRLITPLFGGGVEPAQADHVTLIRATEIRGQLRFWWRAIRGGQPEFEGKLDGMKAREDEIWGAASKIDKREGDQEETQRGERVWIERVQIVVEVVDVGRTIKPFLVEPNKKTGKLQAWPCNDIPGYAAFPLRPPDELLKSASRVEDVLIKDLQQGVIFVLHISFPREWENDIQSALWAWETFGGVGARTRRGFGALQREQIDDSEHIDLPPPDPKKAEDWLREHLRYWVEGEKYPENVPYVGKNVQLQLKPFRGGSMKIWNELIDTLKRFRQERTTGQSGRSPWPEADAIRAITDKNPHHNASERPKKEGVK